MFLVRFGNITVTAAQGLELQVVAAVVVGGVNIFGGSGSMIGAFMGVLLIEILQQSLLRWAGVSEFVKDAILGLLILIAVTADAIILGRLREMWVRTRRRDRARTQPAAGEGARPWRVAAAKLGRAAARLPARGPGAQRHPGLELPDGHQPDQSLPTRHREGDRRPGHGLRHHQRRDRSLGRLDDGSLGGDRRQPLRARRLAAAGDRGGALGRGRFRVDERLLRLGARVELAGGDAGRLHRVPRAGAAAGRGPLGRRFPDVVHRSRPDGIYRIGHVLDHDLRDRGRDRDGGLALQRVRAVDLRDRQQQRRSPASPASRSRRPK